MYQLYWWLGCIIGNIIVQHKHIFYMYTRRFRCAYRTKRSTRASRLPGHALICQPSSYRLARPWGWGGRPCTFPELLGSSWYPAAVEIRPAAAMADPRVDHRQTRPHVRCYGGRLPRLRLQSRCLVPLAGSAPFWIIWRRPWWMPWVCGHEQSTALSTAYRRGSGKRSRRATRRVRACSWRRNPQVDW